MRGRLGSGILERLSLPELIADSPAEYADIVISLVQNPSARERLHAQLLQRLPQAYCDQAVINALEKFLLAVGVNARLSHP